MNSHRVILILSIAAAVATAQCVDSAEPTRVTVDNFNRAESDLYFTRFANKGSFGKFQHEREVATTPTATS